MSFLASLFLSKKNKHNLSAFPRTQSDSVIGTTPKGVAKLPLIEKSNLSKSSTSTETKEKEKKDIDKKLTSIKEEHAPHLITSRSSNDISLERVITRKRSASDFASI